MKTLLKSLLVAMALALPMAGAAKAIDVTTYSPEKLAEAAASGEPYLLDFFAAWCTTCAAQEVAIEQLQAQHKDLQEIQIIRVDWDQYARSDFVRDMAIPRRSTLVLMKGSREIGRLVAETRPARIEELLRSGL